MSDQGWGRGRVAWADVPVWQRWTDALAERYVRESRRFAYPDLAVDQMKRYFKGNSPGTGGPQAKRCAAAVLSRQTPYIGLYHPCNGVIRGDEEEFCVPHRFQNPGSVVEMPSTTWAWIKKGECVTNSDEAPMRAEPLERLLVIALDSVKIVAEAISRERQRLVDNGYRESDVDRVLTCVLRHIASCRC